MIWSHTALPVYEDGTSAEVKVDQDGERYVAPKTQREHVDGEKIVPKIFFEQENTEHISAILFANAGSSSKFNRTGFRASFGNLCVQLIRIIRLNDPLPGAIDVLPFRDKVEDRIYSES